MPITDAIIDAARTLELAATDPLAAAVELEALADQLRDAARLLRERASADDGAGQPRPPTHLIDQYRGITVIKGAG